MKIVLASASERRVELLHRIVDDFITIKSDFDETKVKLKSSISSYVEEIALGKAEAVLYKTDKESIIIGADTVVSIDGKVLGKPKDKQEAFNMLKNLSNRTHFVYTGLALINKENNKILKDSVCTEVKFSKLSDEDINKYIETNEPMDKAGAYGIQGKGGVFVEEIKGCYYNVVGLPLNRLRKMLLEII